MAVDPFFSYSSLSFSPPLPADTTRKIISHYSTMTLLPLSLITLVCCRRPRISYLPMKIWLQVCARHLQHPPLDPPILPGSSPRFLWSFGYAFSNRFFVDTSGLTCQRLENGKSPLRYQTSFVYSDGSPSVSRNIHIYCPGILSICPDHQRRFSFSFLSRKS